MAKYDWLRRFVFSFSVQLLLVHLKKNHTLIIFWAIMFGFITQSLAARYGAPYLFLDPEYLDKSSFLSHLILGFACGGFIMAFNISSYVMNSFRFPFLATLKSPFMRYCVNNGIIPGLFLVIYIINIYKFQVGEEISTKIEIIYHIFGLLIGVFSFIILSTTYFFTINKDIHKMFGVRGQDSHEVPERKLPRRLEWKNLNLIKESRDWYVETYWTYPFVNKLVRPVRHYKKEMLRRIFQQNHRNASLFALMAIVTLFILSFFQDVRAFIIPAGASVFLLFTAYLMITSAVYVWIRGWASTVTLAFFLLINSVYQLDFFHNKNKAYGLNYDNERAVYSNDEIKRINTDTLQRELDIKNGLEILNRWRLKNITDSAAKPKMVIINTSGGGLRSTLWTFKILQYADSTMDGNLLRHTQFITGSSGGMIGAAYLRELYWQKQSGKIESYYGGEYIERAGKDILNAMAFSLTVSDFFFPLQKVEKGNFRYNKDRGYAFEWRFNENTDHVLDKTLDDYAQPESGAIIPTMVFAPTIANDARKLIICSQPVSYLTQNSFTKSCAVEPVYDGIEFSKFFEKQGAKNVYFSSVLRMNSSFPYISPIVTLPSDPYIDVIDAGMRDNFGLELTLKYMYTFRNWITTNTSGVIIIQIRDKRKENIVDENPSRTIIQNMSLPMGVLYSNLFATQDYNQNQLLQYASLWFDQNVEIINLEMRNEKSDKISLSWHLTQKEKRKVLESVNMTENQRSLKRLKELLK